MSWTVDQCKRFTWQRNPNFVTGRWSAYRQRLEGWLRQFKEKLESYLRSGPRDGPYRQRSAWTGLEEFAETGYLRRRYWDVVAKFRKQWEYVEAWLFESRRIHGGVPSLIRVVRRVRRMRWLRWGQWWRRGHAPPG